MVKLEDIDEIISYNGNDTAITKYLAKNSLNKEIKLRKDAAERYNLDCMSWDGVKLGLNVLLKRYCNRTGLEEEYVKKLRTYRESVNINDIILPFIKFKEDDDSFIQFIEKKQLITQFKSFYGLLKYLKTLNVKNTNEINTFLHSSMNDSP